MTTTTELRALLAEAKAAWRCRLNARHGLTLMATVTPMGNRIYAKSVEPRCAMGRVIVSA